MNLERFYFHINIGAYQNHWKRTEAESQLLYTYGGGVASKTSPDVFVILLNR